MAVIIIPSQWDRWIYQSTAKHFKANVSGIPMFVEGGPRETSSLSEWIEYRMLGPDYKQTTRGQFYIDVEIDIAVLVVPQNNAFRIKEVCGLVASAFVNNIDVYRYGDPAVDPANDGTFLGCLMRQNDPLNTFFLGRKSPETPLMQASVSGQYRMYVGV